MFVSGLRCQCKQLQTGPAAARGHLELRTVEEVAREHTTAANFFTMV